MDKTLDKVIKRHIVLTCLTGFAVVLMMVAITYGLYQMHHPNTTDQEISIGDFDVDITSSSGQITLTNLYPGTENNTTYTFTTSNSGDYTVNYEVYFTNNTSIFLATGNNATTYAAYTSIASENYQYILFKLDDTEYRPLSEIYDSTTEKFTLLSGVLFSGDSKTHTVKFMVASDAPNSIQGSILALNITMTATAVSNNMMDKVMKLAEGASTSSNSVITKDAPSGETCTNTVAYDTTTDNNLRYVGADPCNYVYYNGELWRIVGVMNNIEDEYGILESKIRIVRNESLGEFSINTSTASYTSTDWSISYLKTELNTDYLDYTSTGTTTWYNGASNQKTGVYSYSNSLSAAAQNLISTTTWKTGAANSSASTAIYTYNFERSQTFSNGNLRWTGKVAIPYSSDYAFAVGGTVRSSCFTKTISSSYSTYNCNTNSYFFDANYPFWTLTGNKAYYYTKYFITNAGAMSSVHGYFAHHIFPTLYLKTQVRITGGNGSINSPYTLSL